ncbi:MAG: hypothetical protein ACYCQJ_11270 [Nitrososphaerales archaeon]
MQSKMKEEEIDQRFKKVRDDVAALSRELSQELKAKNEQVVQRATKRLSSAK